MNKKVVYSINGISNLLIEKLIEDKDRLDIGYTKGPLNCKIIDAGLNNDGSIEAGLKISDICLGGLGKVNIVPSQEINFSAFSISVHSSRPILACLGSQYAGWSLGHGDFFSLGSGPVRSIVQKEEIFCLK